MSASLETRDLETLFARLAFDLAASTNPGASLSAVVAAQRSILLRPVAPLFEIFPSPSLEDLEIEVDAPLSLELPHSVASAISEFLVEGFRNWKAHGRQSRAERRFEDQSARARVLLSIRVGPSGILVELHDDGPGIHFQRLIEKAKKAGILSEADAAGLQDEVSRGNLQATTELLFRQGLSTRDEAGWDSGRGVGLSRIRQLARDLGGSASAGGSAPLGGFLLRLDLPCSLLGLAVEPLQGSIVRPVSPRRVPAGSEGAGVFRIFHRIPPESREWTRNTLGEDEIFWISLQPNHDPQAAGLQVVGLRLDAPDV